MLQYMRIRVNVHVYTYVYAYVQRIQVDLIFGG